MGVVVDTGFQLVTSGSNFDIGEQDWNNPTRVNQTKQFSTVNLTSVVLDSNFLRTSGVGFTLPSSDFTVIGVEARFTVAGNVTALDTIKYEFRLLDGTSQTNVQSYTLSGSSLTSTFEVEERTITSWTGATLDRAFVTSPNFAFEIQVSNSGLQNLTAFVRGVFLRVIYELPDDYFEPIGRRRRGR